MKQFQDLVTLAPWTFIFQICNLLILTAGVKMILMALLALACGVGAAALAARASMGFGAALRRAEYEQVQRFSFANIERFSTASLVTRLTNDVASVQMTTFMGMRMLVRAPTMLVTALVMALIIRSIRWGADMRPAYSPRDRMPTSSGGSWPRAMATMLRSIRSRSPSSTSRPVPG